MECLIDDLECREVYEQHVSLVTGLSVGISVLVFVASIAVGVIKC